MCVKVKKSSKISNIVRHKSWNNYLRNLADCLKGILPGYPFARADYGTENTDNGVEGEDNHQNVNTNEEKGYHYFIVYFFLKLANLHEVTFRCKGQITLIPLKIVIWLQWEMWGIILWFLYVNHHILYFFYSFIPPLHLEVSQCNFVRLKKATV